MREAARTGGQGRRGRRPTRPDPAEGPIAAFADRLWRLKVEAGDPSYAEMSTQLGAAASKSSLAAAAQGRTLPSWGTTWEFVRVLAVDRLGHDAAATEREWRDLWRRTKTRTELEDDDLPPAPAAEEPLTAEDTAHDTADTASSSGAADVANAASSRGAADTRVTTDTASSSITMDTASVTGVESAPGASDALGALGARNALDGREVAAEEAESPFAPVGMAGVETPAGSPDTPGPLNMLHASGTTNSQDVSDAPSGPSAMNAPDALNVLGGSNSLGEPNASDKPDTAGALEAPNMPDVPDASNTTNTTNTLNVPGASSAPSTSNASVMPGVSRTASAANVPNASSTPGMPKALDVSGGLGRSMPLGVSGASGASGAGVQGSVADGAGPGVRGTDVVSSPRRMRLGAGGVVAAVAVAVTAVVGGTALLSRERTSKGIVVETPPTVQPVLDVDESVFEGDITYPDGTLVRRGEAFEKVWRIRNAGTVAWEGRFLMRANDTICEAPDRIVLPPTRPGESVDVKVWVRAPEKSGSCRIYWKMVDGQGRLLFPDKRPIFLDVRIG